MAVLRITSGPDAGRVIDLEVGDNVVGRGVDVRVYLAHSSVSKRHARLYADCKWFIADLDSKNLTLHNNAEVERGKPCELENGDRLSFGEITAVFDLETPSSALDEAGRALEAATRSLTSLRAELEAARIRLRERDEEVAVRDAALARAESDYDDLLKRVDPSAYLTREQFEEEKQRFETTVKSDAQRQIDAFSRRALDLEQRYVRATASVETLQRQVQERDEQLRVLNDRLKPR